MVCIDITKPYPEHVGAASGGAKRYKNFISLTVDAVHIHILNSSVMVEDTAGDVSLSGYVLKTLLSNYVT